MELIAIFIGGGIGAVSRFALARWVNESVNVIFPLGTLAVNMIGCFVIGVAFGLFGEFAVPNNARAFVITGFLGGFTTFSSFGLETVNLIRAGEYAMAALNASLSVAVGFAFVGLGMLAARSISGLVK